MKYLLYILYLIVSCHLVDASINYFREKEIRSTILNIVLSLISISVGIYVMLH